MIFALSYTCFESLLEGASILACPRLFFGKGKTSATIQFGQIALLKGQFCYKIALYKVQFCSDLEIWVKANKNYNHAKSKNEQENNVFS